MEAEVLLEAVFFRIMWRDGASFGSLCSPLIRNATWVLLSGSRNRSVVVLYNLAWAALERRRSVTYGSLANMGMTRSCPVHPLW